MYQEDQHHHYYHSIGLIRGILDDALHLSRRCQSFHNVLVEALVVAAAAALLVHCVYERYFVVAVAVESVSAVVVAVLEHLYWSIRGKKA